MNYSVTIDHKLKIIRYKHTGELVQKDIGFVWNNEFLKLKEFTELGYHLFSDYSEAQFKMKVEDISFIIEFMRTIRPIVKGKKQSIVIADPVSTAASLLFEKTVNKIIGFRVKVFSTKEAALKWLIDDNK